MFTRDLLPFNYEELAEYEFLALLEHFPWKNWTDISQITFPALSSACRFKYTRAIEYILKQMPLSIILERRSYIYESLAHRAICEGKFETMRTLIKAGLDINAEPRQPGPPPSSWMFLDWAIRFGTPEMIDFILVQGAPLENLNKQGRNSLLICVIERGDLDIYAKLLEYGMSTEISEGSIQLLSHDNLLKRNVGSQKLLKLVTKKL